MLSKAVSESFGVSKTAAIIIVRLPAVIQGPFDNPNLPLPTYRTSILVDGLTRILQDVTTTNIGSRAVISMSIGDVVPVHSFPGSLPQPSDGLFWSYYDIIQQLIAFGVVIVVASGNAATVSTRQSPALF